MFEYEHIPADDCGGKRSDHLPEGIVPRHDREQHPERLEHDPGIDRFGPHGLRREKRRAVLGEPVARQRTLVDLGNALAQRLAHFLSCQVRQLFPAGT